MRIAIVTVLLPSVIDQGVSGSGAGHTCAALDSVPARIYKPPRK
jgi:hypothetical protein